MRPWHIDEHNLIVQKDGDGGDTAQRMGMYFFAQYIYRELDLNLPTGAPFYDAVDTAIVYGKLQFTDGYWRRHPTSWNDPKDFSWEQHNAIVISLGVLKDKLRSFRQDLDATTLNHIKRLGCYQNLNPLQGDWHGDYLFPSRLGVYLRAYSNIVFYPLLIICDLFLVLGSIGVVFKHFDPDNVDDNSRILMLLQTKVCPWYMRTPLSWLARKLYVWLRPKNNGNTELGETCNIMGALAWYFREESGGSPFDELYRPIIEKVLKA